MQAKRFLFGGIVLGFVIISYPFDFPLIFLILSGTCGLVSSGCGEEGDSERNGDLRSSNNDPLPGPERIVTEVNCNIAGRCVATY